MTDTHQCPKCGERMKLSRCKPVGSLTTKRRDCKACGHADAVLMRIVIQSEVLQVLEVAKRAKKTKSTRRTLDISTNVKPRISSRMKGRKHD